MDNAARNKSSARIHPTAVVDPGATIHDSVTLGPFVVIGAEVEIGPHTSVGAHAVIEGPTSIGAHNVIGHHVVLGGSPQVREHSQRRGALRIGEGNTFREFSTVHRGGEDSVTRLGNKSYLMAYSHVAHDCRLGDGIELANAVQLAGHVQVDDHVIIGGLAGVHQFVRVGRHSFVGAGAMVAQDVLPYSLVSGDRARCYGPNSTGLKRHGFSPDARRDLARALKRVLTAPILSDAVAQLQASGQPVEEVRELLAFIQSSRRGFCGFAGRRRKT